MKCQGCGHEYPSTFPRCSRCGELTPRRTLRSSPSRLIEFPRKARVDVDKESSESLLPSWRKELNEKVRAVRARKTAVGTEGTRVETVSPEPEIHQEVQVDTRGRRASASPRSLRTSTAVAKTAPAISPPPPDVPRTSNAIVEAALSRVRRATENASRAALSRIEPVRSVHQNPAPSMSIDREATARALEVTIDLSPKPIISPSPVASARTQRQPQTRPDDVTPTPDLKPDEDLPDEPVVSRRNEQHELDSYVEPVRTVDPRPATVRTLIDPSVTDLESEEDEMIVRVLDEDEPLDYLQAEIRKIDRKRAEEEFAHNESPSLGIHAVIAVIDLLTIAVSSIPFMLVIRIMDGSLGDGRTEIAAGLIILLVSFFYLAVTQCLAGKTFGMMVTNTRVVDVYTFEAPSGQRLLLRTIGYFVAIAPATLGLIWIAFNRYRRGWHDVISGTRVVRDF